MSKPFVSVIVPTFNRAGLVEPAIESVLTQDYEALEVIALDDGSTDETPAVLARIAERSDPERFSWFRHENVGQAATINRGLERARGDLLGYLSSDDALVPAAISRLVEVSEQFPDADVFYPFFDLIDMQGRVFDEVHMEQHTFAHALRWAVCLPGVGALVRRRLYERIGGWDPSYRYCPDFEWWLRAGEAKFVRVPEVLGLWRMHGGSISASGLGLESVRERLRLLDQVYAREDLPAALREVESEAYAATLIQSATVLDPGLGGPDRRFALEDRLGPLWSEGQRREGEIHALGLEAVIKEQRRRLDLLASIAEERSGTMAALDEAGTLRETRVGELEADLAASRAELAASRAELAEARGQLEDCLEGRRRPSWLKLARRLTPPGLRPRVGAAVHRLRRRMG